MTGRAHDGSASESGWLELDVKAMDLEAVSKIYIDLAEVDRLRQHEIQPYFALAHVHNLQIVERLIRQGLYMGPMNGFFSMIGTK